MAHSMNYDFPSKRHWRRSLWNCIGDRVAVPRKDAVVLYLAGAQDEDREVAVQKGFRAHNLIAVDRDKAAVRQLRERGALALCGDVFDHLDAWKSERTIHAVVLDLTCDLTGKVIDGVIRLAQLPHLQGAVIAINVCRGRAGDWRQNHPLLQRHLFSVEDALLAAEQSQAVRAGALTRQQFAERFLKGAGSADTKHRGELLRGMLRAQWVWTIYAATHGWKSEHDIELWPPTGLSPDEKVRLDLAFDASRFQTLSYRSIRRQTYDTLVFCVPMKAMRVENTAMAGLLESQHRGSQLRRLQAAIWAHRTMRMAA